MHHFDAIAALSPSTFGAQQGRFFYHILKNFMLKFTNYFTSSENVKNGLWAMEQKRKEQNNYRERQRVAKLNKLGFRH